jgi:hypothetical protein
MKLKDFLYLIVIAFLLIKVMIGSPEKTKYLPANKDSLNSYKRQIAELQKLLLVSNNERDSIQKYWAERYHNSKEQ